MTAPSKRPPTFNPFWPLPEAEEAAFYEMALATKRVEPRLRELVQKGVSLNPILTILWLDLSYQPKRLMELWNRVLSLWQKQITKDRPKAIKRLLAEVGNPAHPPKSLKEAMLRVRETDAMKQVQELASRAALIASGKEAVGKASAALGKKAAVVRKASQALLNILIEHDFSVNQAAIDTHELLQQWNPAIAVDTPDAIRTAYYRAIRSKS